MTDQRMLGLLAPYLEDCVLPENSVGQLQAYLDLLLRWNEKTNLTAIRDAETMVSRHFGESLFSATVLAPMLPQGASVLDFGSGAGFPGLPIQIFRPDLRMTLAESQNKKSAFLREVIRSLGLATTVFSARAETMPTGTAFDCVAMRAVDRMDSAIKTARHLCAPRGVLALLTTPRQQPPATGQLLARKKLPESADGELQIYDFA